MYEFSSIYYTTDNNGLNVLEILMIIYLINYIVGSLGLFLIFRRMKEQFAIKAFIPILRTISKSKYSNVKRYWFIPCFIPYIDVLYYCILTTVVNIKFVKALGVSNTKVILSTIFSSIILLYLSLVGGYNLPYYNNQLRFDRKVYKRF